MLLHRDTGGSSTLLPLDLALQKVREKFFQAPFLPFLFHSSFPHAEGFPQVARWAGEKQGRADPWPPSAGERLGRCLGFFPARA